MKFSCDCGRIISDQTDALPHKAHLIPDQLWNSLWDEIDANILLPLSQRRLTEEAASMRLRTLISNATRLAYQCPDCGRLFLDVKQPALHAFVPADVATPRDILSATLSDAKDS